ncbi:MAG: hypothetical protein WAU47_03680, partial [Desulfobaccales bacterium]
QGAKDQAPKILPEKQYILKFPLNQGASWKQQAEGFILEDTIIDTKGSVQTPAGAFQDCLVLKRIYFHPKNPNTPLQEALFWFAPGVGNVKTIIKHTQENKEIVQELVSFTK